MMGATDAARGGAINWFEPPTADIGAATGFYARALETVLAGAAPSAREPGYVAVPDISAAIACRRAAGWRALTDIIDLPAGIGRIVHMLDADGGRIGLHQPGARA